ncbi:hypothetical protein EIQ06_02925 [Xanthomonas campestris pv. campestris]|uniref:Uncharacterized protein n=1 Tax=Xanthomonas campestris pv. campestris (strain B100) TaxID=509169 RepID=B0RPL6_XANCB|nr:MULTISPECIES: hypothetical protein [Xanthomonas]MCC8495791.1 hypothetical protein [Xanthomonas hortorum pv. gardneri]MCE4530214.1 hypothetical protein [Xanthomonas hortorum pv. vitians]MEA0626137.1 hypothetical protein [Xanthomonas campestris pv. campestris]MEA0667192.1 hypothetical protein [Xanthomonas campestris pv. campestris]MEA0675559.1 hypothetical protein [Xanthomonas campestris pv. campestris]
MNSADETDSSIAQGLLMARKAISEGIMHLPPNLQRHADELMSAPLTALGLVDTTGLSQETLMIFKSFAAAASMARQPASSGSNPANSTPASVLQVELFGIFSNLFSAITGRAYGLVNDEIDLKPLIMSRVRQQPDSFASSVNSATEELEDFYTRHAVEIFRHAKTLGGMRLVTGGQRKFGLPALSAVRITGLYADTQLIPDPIFPFIGSDLSLNAVHLQLAIQLFYVLRLRPLVDAELPVPPVFVFPSFEEQLEREDAHTKLGIERLAIRLLGPLCKGQVSSIEELLNYALNHEDAFLTALMPSGLFVAPGDRPNLVLSSTEAASRYLRELEGIRASTALEQLKRLPTGVLLTNGILERLRPQYHLLENANELGAQPLLSQPVHWHYFEKISLASAMELRSQDILSEQAFQTLKAVQDDSLSWLANIPVETLADLLVNSEHRWFREELNKYTTQLATAGPIETNDMVREVSHGLSSLVQRQKKVLTEIERKYAPKKAAAYAGGLIGVGAAATAVLLPSLAPLLGAAAPTVALAGAAWGYGKEKIGEKVEKRQAAKSMLGVLATVRPAS